MIDLEVVGNLDPSSDLGVDTLEVHTALGVDPGVHTAPGVDPEACIVAEVDPEVRIGTEVDPGVHIETGVDLGVQIEVGVDLEERNVPKAHTVLEVAPQRQFGYLEVAPQT